MGVMAGREQATFYYYLTLSLTPPMIDKEMLGETARSTILWIILSLLKVGQAAPNDPPNDPPSL